jgi:hypothetical protein
MDLFRGLALWMIFVDHIPGNVVSRLTLRNYGLSDASEIFIFISGYTAALVYGRIMQERGAGVASARILRRSWQLYVAHLFLFAVYLAEVSYAASEFDDPLFARESHLLGFLHDPAESIVQALLLKFKPVNLDVLPIYILFMLGLPPVLWMLQRVPAVPLAASAALYALAWSFGWNLPAYPAGEWFFNPLAWQLLFVLGAWCGAGGATRVAHLLRSRPAVMLAAGYLVFGFAIAASWNWHAVAANEPGWLHWLAFAHPVDKTDLDPLRLLHFAALAVLVARFVPRDWPAFGPRVLRPVIACGQHSLEVFCFGIFLAFAAHFVLVEFWPGWMAQIVLSVLGIVLMVSLAELMTWYRREEAKQPSTRSRDGDEVRRGQSRSAPARGRGQRRPLRLGQQKAG